MAEEEPFDCSRNKENVAVLYSHSSLPILSTNSGELVNLVEFPNVEQDEELGLDTTLEYQRSIVLEDNLVENDDHMHDITNSQIQHHFQLLDSNASNKNNSCDANSFPNIREGESNLLPDHLMQIPTSEISSNNQSMNLPFSIIGESPGVSIIQNINQLPISISNGISVTSGGESNSLLYCNNSESNAFDVSTFHTSDDSTIQIKTEPDIESNVVPKFQQSNNFIMFLKSNQVGRPPKRIKNKFIGVGPSAISAQGIVQQIDNRLVTVLPRPEDLKKLIDNKVLRGKKSFDDLKYTNSMFQQLYALQEKKKNIYTTPHSNTSKYSSISEESSSFDEKCTNKNIERKSMANSSSTRRVGRPRKNVTSTTIIKGCKMIHTEDVFKPIYRSLSGKCNPLKIENDFEETEYCSPTNLEDFVKDKTASQSDNIFRRRKLPPRKRGLRYKKLLERLQRAELSEEFDSSASECCSESDDENSGSKLYKSPKPMMYFKDNTMGKLRNPDNTRCQKSSERETRVIELSENLLTINSANSSSLIEEDSVAMEGPHGLVINVEPTHAPSFAETASVDLHPLPSEYSSKRLKPVSDPDSLTNIFVVAAGDDYSKEEKTTLLVEENGQYEERFECPECGESSMRKMDQLRHLLDKHNVRPFECNVCKKVFVSKSAYLHHSYLHQDDALNRCSQCNLKFSSDSEFRRHLDEHERSRFAKSDELCRDPLVCEKKPNRERCSCGFSSARDSSHTCEDAKLYVCDICKLKFMSSGGLNRHRQVHDRAKVGVGTDNDSRFRCKCCHAKFSFEDSLNEHVMSVHCADHSLIAEAELNNSVISQLRKKLNEGYAPKNSELYDEPAEEEIRDLRKIDPFKCGICDDPFKDIDVLCEHYAVCHVGNQSIFCEVCSVGCGNATQLERHKAIHAKEEMVASSNDLFHERPYSCFVCKKSFHTQQELNKHSKFHLKSKPYKCNFCDAQFLIKSALDKHLLVHSGKRPFICDICFKGFRQSAALVRHKLWTHRLKNQNKCEICGKTVFTRQLLLFHLDSHGQEGLIVKNRLLKSSNSGKTPTLNSMSKCSNDPDSVKEKDSEENAKSRTCEYCHKDFPTLVSLLSHKISHRLSASYKCDVCHKTFREKRFLKKHKLSHKTTKRWKCDICSKAFATKLTLIRHYHVHIREALMPDYTSVKDEFSHMSQVCTHSDGLSLPRDLFCKQCKISFSHKSHYVRHMLLHSDVPILKCGICDKICVHKSDLIRHKVMHSFMFTCHVCFKNFHKRSLFEIHVKKHSDSKPFKCDQCNKGFSTSANYKTHMRIHSGEKPYHCNICDYKCSQSGRLMKHKRMHTGIKLAHCKICGKAYSSNESLKAHLRLHTGEKPFQCQTCNKTFRNSTSLSQHAKDHLKEEMYKCDQCDHKFRRSDHFEKHKLFHKMERQVQSNSELGLDADSNIDSPLYMCELCGRVFEKKKYLYNHHNVHSRERIFSCVMCNKQLQSRLALKNHMMIHTGLMPHQCVTCNKSFRNLSNLKRHEKIHQTNETFECEVCGDSFCSNDLLNKHKEIHVNLMMINADPVGVSEGEMNEPLYVFDNVDQALDSSVDPTPQLMVQTSQPSSFLVENSHSSLLVFPESNSEEYENPPLNPETKVENSSSPPPQVAAFNQSDSMHGNQEFMINEKIPESTLSGIIVDKTLGKPYQCDVCFKFFAKRQYLTKHKYRHREVKPHACEECGKRFAQKFEVAVHKLKHTGERPYQCDICSKDFRSKVNLMNHRMKHTGEYPYLCSICHRGLSTQIQLERHVSLHTGSQPFNCQICGKGFFQKFSLKKHMTRCHNAHHKDSLSSNKPVTHEENMEVMEAISNITSMSVLTEDKHLLNLMPNKKIKVNDEPDLVHVEGIPISDMDDLADEAQFSVSDHSEYILGPSSEIDTKFFHSILNQVRVEVDCESEGERNSEDVSDM